MVFTTKNPFTNEHLNSYKSLTDAAVEEIIEKAHHTFQKFRHLGAKTRKEKMLNMKRILLEKKHEYASMITNEMGKPISQSIAEIEKCALVCEHYAVSAEGYLQDRAITTDSKSATVTYEPLGVILAIMPWNYPFWQVFRVLAPNIMLGNSVILKHAENTLGCGELIQDIVEQAGFKPYTFSHIIIEENQTEKIIAHKLIKGVTFTGSTKGGSAVASLAGKYIKKSVLELGGSNALVVFDDADLEKTADICVKARFQNTGQSCIAGKRLVIQEHIYKRFLNLIIKKVKQLNVSNPTDKETDVSVMAREDLAENLKNQLDDSLKRGAKLILGGKQQGTFFEPTLVESDKPDLPVLAEETFGPLMAITTFKNKDEALNIINASNYGLGTSIFTTNMERFDQMLPHIDDGAVFLNAMVKSDPLLPFGGTKQSGYGRELGKEGILEFANIKTVSIEDVRSI
jgi:succinate-semialdehyde dehydrogenase/glutarate-semialdehyde dehydrogenase